jgi:hypothetical protein
MAPEGGEPAGSIGEYFCSAVALLGQDPGCSAKTRFALSESLGRADIHVFRITQAATTGSKFIGACRVTRVRHRGVHYFLSPKLI